MVFGAKAADLGACPQQGLGRKCSSCLQSPWLSPCERSNEIVLSQRMLSLPSHVHLAPTELEEVASALETALRARKTGDKGSPEDFAIPGSVQRS